ncbi:TetR family transcriptional regulator [Aquibium sp. A9E412]|uniref:TetR/AcrR family transcriptional regulator n=1 Tax=Aquibium sp. A9E412 TaxID=2976767 RepID=UPI0025AEEC83|nr:TetR/AcrR family transcriptional regulator [Aquibium sp. A9E412]MDN2567607.1 TetR family transcriptional regulator [Aquibium sp. A9E412]
MRTAKKKKSRADLQRERREALISAGLTIVSRSGYANASVSRVTAAAGLAQGTLYSYFDNHQVFLDTLLEAEGRNFFRFLDRHTVRGESFFETERSSFLAYSRYVRRHRYFPRVLTDAESAAPTSYADHMERVEARYLKALMRGQAVGELRPQSEAELRVVAEVLAGSYGHMSIGAQVRPFGKVGRDGLFPEWIADTYIRFIRSGLGQTLSEPPPAAPARPPEEAVATTREALLEAAARVVWRVGFDGATIKAIVEEANLAVGTFYSHFDSQQEIFDELLAYIRVKMLAHVRGFIGERRRFVDREYAGFVGFFDYLRDHPWYIRIESAAAVYATDTYRRHFLDLTDSYVRTLRRARQNGELAQFEEHELVVLAHIFMAARHYIAARYLPHTAERRTLPPHVFATYRAFLEGGLAVDPPAGRTVRTETQPAAPPT